MPWVWGKALAGAHEGGHGPWTGKPVDALQEPQPQLRFGAPLTRDVHVPGVGGRPRRRDWGGMDPPSLPTYRPPCPLSLNDPPPQKKPLWPNSP